MEAAPARPERSRIEAVARQAVQIAVAGLGGALLAALGVPAAWLSGAMLATALWGALGLGRPLPRPLVEIALLISGASMGAAVTPEAIAVAARYPLSLLILAAAVVAVTAGSMAWLTLASGWRRDDALLASAPGAFSTVLAVAVERNAAVAEIAVVQTFRIFVLMAILPSVVAALGSSGPGPAAIEAYPSLDPVGLAAVLLAGLAIAHGFRRIGMAAPVLLGATVASMVLHAAGWAPGVVPPAIAWTGLVLLGMFVAERFRSLRRAALVATLPAALGSFLVSIAIAAACAGAAALAARVAFADALVAFAPGGLEAMMVLAFVLGLDPLYVGVHHVARFVGIGLALPLAFSRLRRRREPG